MSDTYSTYEAKSRFSEIIRRVREGRRIVISYHGQPVAEITPIAPSKRSLAEALSSLERDGVVTGGHRHSAEGMSAWRAVARKPGALRRFLKSREQ